MLFDFASPGQEKETRKVTPLWVKHLGEAVANGKITQETAEEFAAG